MSLLPEDAPEALGEDSESKREPSRRSILQTPNALMLLALGEWGLMPVAWLIQYFFAYSEPDRYLFVVPGSGQISSLIQGAFLGLLLFGGYLFTERSQWLPLVRIRTTLRELLGDALRRSSWWHLAFVALSAGITEEYLFRGVLEPRIGFLASNLLFGLVHPHSSLYVILAFLIGGVMSASLHWTGSLWTPITAHAVYDFAVLLKIAAESRRSRPEGGA